MVDSNVEATGVLIIHLRRIRSSLLKRPRVREIDHTHVAPCYSIMGGQILARIQLEQRRSKNVRECMRIVRATVSALRLSDKMKRHATMFKILLDHTYFQSAENTSDRTTCKSAFSA